MTNILRQSNPLGTKVDYNELAEDAQYDQAWNVADSDLIDKGNITEGVWIENTSSKTVKVFVAVDGDSQLSYALDLSPDDGTTIYRGFIFESSTGGVGAAIMDVPPGWYYRVSAPGNITSTLTHVWMPMKGA